MPKLPLFKDQPLNPCAVDAFRELLGNPDNPQKMEVINDLLDLHNDRESPVSENLAWFAIENGVFGSGMLGNAFASSIGRSPPRKGFRATMHQQMVRRVLEYAAAAGFLPVPEEKEKHEATIPGP